MHRPGEPRPADRRPGCRRQAVRVSGPAIGVTSHPNTGPGWVAADGARPRAVRVVGQPGETPIHGGMPRVDVGPGPARSGAGDGVPGPSDSTAHPRHPVQPVESGRTPLP
jgi:hypothetical protein